MPPLYHRVWQWIKYSVNHDPVNIPNKDGSSTLINPGQRATSYRQIANEVGYYEGKKWKEPNPKTIKSILDWMMIKKMIRVQGNTLGTIITVENWVLYQEELTKGNTKRITPSTRRKHHLDTNNNDNNDNNDKKVIKSIGDVVTDYTENTILQDSINDFIEHRKAIKKPLSTKALELTFKNLDKLTGSDKEKADILNQSIANGWQGVFAIKQDFAKQSFTKETNVERARKLLFGGDEEYESSRNEEIVILDD
jgi:hypothetical protein